MAKKKSAASSNVPAKKAKPSQETDAVPSKVVSRRKLKPTEPDYDPRDNRSQRMSVPPDCQYISPKAPPIAVWRPTMKEGPLVFRPLPMFRADDPTHFERVLRERVNTPWHPPTA